MSDRAEFEKWRDDAVLRGKKDFTDMDWHLCWLGWQAARAQGGQGAEPVGFVQGGGLEQLSKGHPAIIYPKNVTLSPLEPHTFVYTHPQPTQPDGDGWVLVPADHLPEVMETAAVAAAREYMARTGGNCMKTIYKALVNAAQQPPAEQEGV